MITKKIRQKNFLRQALSLILIVVIIAWGIVISYISPTKLIRHVGTKNGYVIGFIASLLGGLSTFTTVPYDFVILSLATAKELNPIILGLAAGLGVVIGDSTSYLLGYHGRHILPERFKKFFGRIVQWCLHHPTSWLIPLGLFIYGGFIPFSDDFIIIPLALGRYPYWKLMIPLSLGNIMFNIGVALLGAHGLGFLNSP